jgi:hypothetical protein
VAVAARSAHQVQATADTIICSGGYRDGAGEARNGDTAG